MFTSDRQKMGDFVNGWWVKTLAYTVAVVIAALNAWLLVKTVAEWVS
jgi:manganese transport protein